MSDDVIPFSCGSEWYDWRAANCDTCTKAAKYAPPVVWTCDIERALSSAAVGTGRIPLAIAERMGRGAVNALVWRCREYDSKGGADA